MSEKKIISYPGVVGSFSYLAATEVFPQAEYIGFTTFSETMMAVKERNADYAIVPVENSEAGRVADLHILLPNSELFITGEHYKRIEHHLLGTESSSAESIKTVYSHSQALAQCSKYLGKNNIETVKSANTAIAAKEVAALNDPSIAAIASLKAAETYRLKILKKNIENSNNNTTRFLVIASNPEIPKINSTEKTIVTLMFHLKNIPSALYNALGAFAANNVNLTRIESCIGINNFCSAMFLVDIEAHSESDLFKKTISDLKNRVEEVKILGTYKASPYRSKNSKIHL